MVSDALSRRLQKINCTRDGGRGDRRSRLCVKTVQPFRFFRVFCSQALFPISAKLCAVFSLPHNHVAAIYLEYTMLKNGLDGYDD